MMRNHIALMALLVSFSAFAADDSHQSRQGVAAIPLSEGILTLLRQEMQEVKSGMEALVYAAASGDWHEMEVIGNKIRDGYIMKQELTGEQRKELDRALPDEFKQLDQKFHHYAEMLGKAAKERDIDLVNYAVYKMSESCSACHAQFAAHRFTDFASTGKPAGHMH